MGPHGRSGAGMIAAGIGIVAATRRTPAAPPVEFTAFLSQTGGNDTTAVVNSAAQPFATLEAAIGALYDNFYGLAVPVTISLMEDYMGSFPLSTQQSGLME